MTEGLMVKCIVCDHEYSQEETDKFQPLTHFEDSCICNECLRKEHEGWPKPKSEVKS